jgi:hypothetical protein
MPDDTEIDLSTFPTGVDFPSALDAPAGEGSGDAAVTLIPFPFCLLFAGRPWLTLTVAAPSPGEAATTMDQFVRQVANPTLVRMGYPPNICSWSAGACPV